MSTFETCNQIEKSIITEPTNQVIPPPAPPPPPLSTITDQKASVTWMVKHLHSQCNS